MVVNSMRRPNWLGLPKQRRLRRIEELAPVCRLLLAAAAGWLVDWKSLFVIFRHPSTDWQLVISLGLNSTC